MPGIDQDHRNVCSRCASRHVPRVLFMTRCVRHDEFAMFRREKSIGNIDGNTLFAFGCKAVYQQRKVNVTVLGPMVP